MRRLPLIIILLCLSNFSALAQRLGTMRDSLYHEIKNESSFSIYKDNYFVMGIPLNVRPTKDNSNIKYHISFKQRLTNAVLPLNSFLFLTYSQKAFWDIFKYSKPFAEINFKPSGGVAIPIFSRDKLKGMFSLMVEHESNGRDSI